METIHNEWHRTPENKRILEALMKMAFETDNILIAHHLCYKKAGEEKEIASAETLIFNHEFLQHIFGDEWETAAKQLAITEPHLRLGYFKTKGIIV